MKQQKANVSLLLSNGKRLLPLLFLALISPAIQAKLTTAALTEWKKHIQIVDDSRRADGPSFYLYTNADWTPEKELSKTIEVINSDNRYGRLKQLPQCAFPARVSFLKKYQLAKIEPQKCKDFKMWKRGINAESISMIYASSYPNNPASTFGHTFIRFNSKNKTANRDLLDYGLNFAATTGSDGGIEFAFFGIFGFYQGHFSIAPYYIKTNEYNNYENRDLWEYRLNYTTEEVSTLLDYIWELESTTHFDYFFFDENCSYMLLTLLDRIRPNQKLLDNQKVYVAPIDTIKSLKRGNLIENRNYRPSLKTIFQGHYYSLQKKEKKDFYTLIASNELPKDLSTPTIDTAIHFYKDKKFRGHLAQTKKNFFHKMLKKRAKISDRPKKVSVIKEDPSEGHDSYVAGVGQSFLDGHGFLNLMLGLGIHSIYDRDTGYIPFSSIDLLKASIRLDRELKTYLDHLKIIDVKSFEPFTIASKSVSWRFESEVTKEVSSSWDTRILAGPTFEMFKNTRVFLQVGPYQEVTKTYNWGASAIIGAINKNKLGKSHIEYEKLYDKLQTWSSSLLLGQSIHVSKQASIILKFQRKKRTKLSILWNQHF